jgi:phosphonate transport system substrate-binding protein
MSNLSRRTLLALAAAGATSPVLAQQPASGDWRRRVPEIRIGISSAENEAAALARQEPMAAYLTRELGVPVRLYRTSDYAGLVEAMRADQIEFARFGPAVYSLGRRVLGDKLRPLFRDVDNNGQEGYFSIVIVRADSPFRTIEDLRGRQFAFVDPNSTSGFAFPSYFLRKEGFDPRTHFRATVFAGSHDNVVLATARGQFEGGATFEVNEQSGVPQRMVNRGLIPAGSLRTIWRSPLIPASPFTARADLPEELVQAYIRAMQEMRERAADVWRNFTDGQVLRYAPARHEDYLDVIAVMEELERDRRRGS